MHRQTVESIAASVTRVLKTAVESEGALDDADSWVNALKKLGARVRKYKDDSEDALPGFFISDALGGVIYYNSRADEITICRRLCHEGAHFVMAQWFGSGLRRTAPEHYDDQRQTKQHRAARMVEELLLP